VIWSVTIVAMIVLGLAVADTIQRYRTLAGGDSRKAVHVANDRKTGRPTTIYRMDEVIAAHLFGQQRVTTEPKTIKAPETKLKLTLQGVVVSKDPQYAQAIIAVESEPGRNYTIGEMVDKTDARLHAIEAMQVLLERNGLLESLPFVRLELAEGQVAELGVKTEGAGPANLVDRRSPEISAAIDSRRKATKDDTRNRQPFQEVPRRSRQTTGVNGQGSTGE